MPVERWLMHARLCLQLSECDAHGSKMLERVRPLLTALRSYKEVLIALCAAQSNLASAFGDFFASPEAAQAAGEWNFMQHAPRHAPGATLILACLVLKNAHAHAAYALQLTCMRGPALYWLRRQRARAQAAERLS